MSKKYKHKKAPSWLDKALLDPGSIFSNPTQVADNPDLTLDDKLRILRSWEYDATEIAVSLEEGMPGAEEEFLQCIVQTILRIDPDHFINTTSPTKHHALLSKA
ncbi:MAG: hypothetical protein H0U73_08865 [Tatlockia sp.]|nr:hypothetical protein [Tatlockia sp.]